MVVHESKLWKLPHEETVPMSLFLFFFELSERASEASGFGNALGESRGLTQYIECARGFLRYLASTSISETKSTKPTPIEYAK